MGFRFDYLRGDLAENRAYGNQSVLARACGVKTDDLKIFARYQHGLGTSAYWPDNRIPSLAWSTHIVDAGWQKGFRNIYAIGAPIIYYRHQTSEHFNLKKKKYSLCIAPHSTFDAKQDIFHSNYFQYHFPDYRGNQHLVYFAQKCLYESNFPPLILLYYKDATHNTISQLEGMGIEVLTLGDGIFDTVNQDNYFDRQYNLLLNSQEILVCNTNTLWVYGGYLGKKIRPLSNSNFKNGLKRVSEFFDKTDPESNNFFNLIVGENCLKNTSELMEIFGSSSLNASLKRKGAFMYESVKNGKHRLVAGLLKS